MAESYELKAQTCKKGLSHSHGPRPNMGVPSLHFWCTLHESIRKIHKMKRGSRARMGSDPDPVFAHPAAAAAAMPVGGGACCPPPMPPFLSPAPLLLWCRAVLSSADAGPLQAVNIGQPQQSPPAKFLVRCSAPVLIVSLFMSVTFFFLPHHCIFVFLFLKLSTSILT